MLILTHWYLTTYRRHHRVCPPLTALIRSQMYGRGHQAIFFFIFHFASVILHCVHHLPGMQEIQCSGPLKRVRESSLFTANKENHCSFAVSNDFTDKNATGKFPGNFVLGLTTNDHGHNVHRINTAELLLLTDRLCSKEWIKMIGSTLLDYDMTRMTQSLRDDYLLKGSVFDLQSVWSASSVVSWKAETQIARVGLWIYGSPCLTSVFSEKNFFYFLVCQSDLFCSDCISI